MLTLTTFVQNSIGRSSHSHQTRKRNKRNSNWKGKSKVLLFAHSMILYLENPKDPTKRNIKTKKWIQWCCKIQINVQEYVAFPYTNNELSRREGKKMIIFIITSKRIKLFSVTKLYLTLCDSMDCRTPSFSVLHYFPEFVHIHVHWVTDAI